ncbi:hypothetical protein Cylst_5624 [Cylindrospermum stagnale PCC 7417]|uniref:Uncharacterized protein n=1 Tax=Cylindrospermum stagnale PCC 7417 TaxID=56107 RepID=K9X4N4_9NOST|nr:hypothetical protein [Cylindrospermum stagnale]AFZ27625.1 hypothetical protein Cylst_5624 [Cylindrospermum stagnale PCC 7417]
MDNRGSDIISALIEQKAENIIDQNANLCEAAQNDEINLIIHLYLRLSAFICG